MAIFAFETITAGQALGIGAGDNLTVGQATGSATLATVIYEAGGNIDLVFGAQTVVFGPSFATLAQQAGHITFSDGSLLYVGDAAANSFTGATFSASGATASAAAFGGAGADSLTVSGPHSVLQGNAGNDILTGGAGDDTIYGGQDNDTITVGTGTNFGQGNKGDDTLTGAGTNDTLLGGQGDDRIVGAGFLNGNLGNDSVSGAGQMFGEDGNDTLVSIGTGRDSLVGGNGDDSIAAGLGSDSISGDAGNDTINGSSGGHSIFGGAGADKFIFGSGPTALGSVPKILDWTGGEDTFSFLGFSPNFGDLTTTTAPDYATALSMATTTITTTHFNFVEVQVGADVFLFAGGAGGPATVVELVGRSLADFTAHNLV